MFIVKLLLKRSNKVKRNSAQTNIFSTTAYVENVFIGEGRRLIFDTLEMSESLNLKRFIVSVDTEKAFDLLSHSFLAECFKK